MAKVSFPGNPSVISTFQSALAMEAHLNLQYRLYQQYVKYRGLKKTAKKMKKFGDEAHYFMKAVTKQILFLGGDVGAGGYSIGKIEQPGTLTDMFTSALALEMALVRPYEDAIENARVARDDASRNLYEHLRKWHNGIILWLGQQLNLIDTIGEDDYITTVV